MICVVSACISGGFVCVCACVHECEAGRWFDSYYFILDYCSNANSWVVLGSEHFKKKNSDN